MACLRKGKIATKREGFVMSCESKRTVEFKEIHVKHASLPRCRYVMRLSSCPRFTTSSAALLIVRAVSTIYTPFQGCLERQCPSSILHSLVYIRALPQLRGVRFSATSRSMRFDFGEPSLYPSCQEIHITIYMTRHHHVMRLFCQHSEGLETVQALRDTHNTLPSARLSGKCVAK